MTDAALARTGLGEARSPVRPAIGRRAADTVSVIDSLADFLALRDEWDALFARAALPHHVFQSHVFLRHWAAHYLDRGDGLRILTARRAGRLVMVWPLVRRARFGVVRLRFMGAPVAQFGDVLVEPGPDQDALLAAGWAALSGLGADMLEIRKLRADSALARTGALGAAAALQTERAPFADLAPRVGADGPSLAYPARERSNHRRRLRRLAERGALGFERHEPGPEAARLARSAVAMKQAALLRHGVIAPAVTDPRFAAFFADFAADAAGGSSLRAAVVTCDGLAIAIDLALDCKGVSFGHVNATHPDHERGGVGRILVHHSFASALARGSRRFDLLAPADAYKIEHADGFVAVEDFVLPLSLKGRLLGRLGLNRLRPLAKRAAGALPGGLARRLAMWSAGAKG